MQFALKTRVSNRAVSAAPYKYSVSDLVELSASLYDGVTDAGWSSSVARWAHNPEVVGSNPAPATRTNR